MTKRATKTKPAIPEYTAGELQRSVSRVIRAAEYGQRTAITFHGRLIAGVVSADDLKTLEEAS